MPARSAPFRLLARGLLVALALIAALMAASSAWARDGGDWQILNARYGTAQRNVDVTDRLRDLARSDRRVKITNDLFGVDPAPREWKTLRIYARSRSGENRTFEYREGNVIDGDNFTGWGRGDWGQGGGNGNWEGPRPGGDRQDDGGFQILAARYGVPDAHIDVTGRLKELARRDARVQITNGLFRDDPAPRQWKTLRIYARGRDGQVRTFEYKEGEWIDGSQFTGWGRGDWGQGGWNGGWDGRPGNNNPGGFNPGGYGPAADNRVTIVRATYGSGRNVVDVTQRIRNISRGGPLDVRVDNDLTERDPAVGDRKTLRVYFIVGRGQEQMAEAREGERLRIP